jgi:hypothetical protein
MVYQTGDIIFFRGTGTGFDTLIETVTNSPYSHVAMVVVNPSWIESPGTYVIQSLFRSGHAEACEQHQHRSGVQMNLLSDIDLKHADIRRLSSQISMDALATIHARVHNVSYDYGLYHWLMGGLYALTRISWFAPARHDDTFWCSALVSYIYKELGLLPDSIDWSAVSPADLSTMSITHLGNIEKL